ncbi:SDR family oxidoreductase [Egibacter rhizosphaerae]|uniref:SDR family oxidoreductase n=2 Tax=Egibacter rhizosphaerae TaxID=1670831 RepID=A0A411YL03_9ACTN|nr:SDR family oxidoreductase [Egibacter rhizosphaerae]
MLESALAGKVTWVTGASRGLGAAIAHGLARAGATLALTARRPDGLSETAKRVEAEGASVECLPADVSDATAVAAVAGDITHRLGRIDALVHAAGISPTVERAETLEIAEWQRIIDSNLGGAFLCARSAAQQMPPAGGSVLLISSIHGTVGMPRLAAYGASKGGIEALTRSLSLEWAHRGIRVNAVAPGYFETDMTSYVRQDPEWRDQLLARIPIGRFGTPEELVPTALFLVSDLASYITGTTVHIDGGWLAA